MKRIKKVMLFTALLILLIGAVTASDTTNHTTVTNEETQTALQDTTQVSQTDTTQEKNNNNNEIIRNTKQETPTTKNIQKNTNKANTKTETEKTVNNWTTLNETINTLKTATENTTITLNPGTYTALGLIDWNNTNIILTIDGNGQTINANQHQAFYIQSGTTVILKNIIITNATNNGGYGGAIYNSGNLTITNTTLNNNTATQGGAIYNYFGTITITNHTTLQYNTAEWGGAISNYGTITITNHTTLQHNTAKRDGGAIENCETITITNHTTLQHNTATRGGAINNWVGNTSIYNSTLQYNNATQGGAIYYWTIQVIDTVVVLYNSTFTENKATNGSVIQNVYGYGKYNITLNKFQQNKASNDKETLNLGSDIKEGSIIEDNTYENTDISTENILTIPDGKTKYTTDDEITLNFTIEPEHPEYYDEDISEKINLETIDKTLYINGQKNVTTNKTMYTLSNLNPGKYDVKYSTGNQESNTVTFKVICDFETYVSNYTELVEAITNATNEEYASYKINLLPGNYIATQNINWENSATKKIIINGNGITLDGQNTYYFITIATEHTLTLENITITNYTAVYGGAINNNGTLTITNTTLNNNTAQYGGAINNNNGTLTITNTTLQYNTATNDGGAIENWGTITINHTTLQHNTAEYGGAIDNWVGNTSIYNSTLQYNNATNGGGAIYYATSQGSDTVVVLYNSTFTENKATNGSVIQNNGGYGKYNITFNKFQQNTASNDKETLNLGSDIIYGSIIEDNTYENTDISIENILTIPEGNTKYATDDEITLNFTIELEHPEYYDEDILEKINKTLYINGQENITTNERNHTLKELIPNKYEVYFIAGNQQSNTITFTVTGDSQIKTDKDNYEHYTGIKNTITLNITDPSKENGTINIQIKEDNTYKDLLTYPNVYDGYTLTTDTIIDALKNVYTNLEDAYTINITYNSTNSYVNPSSTEFTLNINKQRNTTITYYIINNTEGNVQINITVLDVVYNTPILDANIQITGDINQNTTTGIITDTTLTQGTYTINVRYNGTDNYKSSETTINFNVEIDKDKIIEKLEELVENLNNTIQEQNITIDNLNKTIQEQNNTINNMNNTINNQSERIDELEEIISQLTAAKETNIIFDPIIDAKYNTNVTISGILINEDSVGLFNQIVTLIIGDKTVNVTTKGGLFEYNTTLKTVGEQTITAKFLGTDKYKASNTTQTFTVNKQDTLIIIDEMEDVKYKDIVTITGTFKNVNGQSLTNSNIKVTINGITSKVKTDNKGRFTIEYEASSVGDNTIRVVYAGNAKYNGCETTTTFTVDKKDTILKISEISDVKYQDTITITGTFKNSDGNALRNSNVIIYINGEHFTVRTDNNGVFTCDYKATIMGENNITVRYLGNAKYNAAEATTTFTVDKKDTAMTVNPIADVNKGDTVTVTGTFKNSDGTAFRNSNVIIYINNAHHTVKTDTNGNYNYTFTAKQVGDNNIRVVFNGNAKYNACETNTTFTIKE